MPNTLAILMEEPLTQGDEAALIEAAQQDPTRFKPLYLRWVKPIYQYLFFRMRSQAEAEDLTSQVFLKAYEQLPHYRHQGCFSAWLFTIARNTARDHYRRSRQELPIDAKGEPAVHPDLLGQVIHSDQLKQLSSLIQGLREPELELIRLRYAAGLNYREIGAITGQSQEAVRKSITRLLARLHGQMQDKVEAENV